jgi:thiol-disulfide isomerase/thioredoxin
MPDLRKKIETAANVAIITAVLLTIGLAMYIYIPGKPAPSGLKTGDKLTQAGIDWSGKDRTLILVLQKTCPFCADSIPFYRKIAKKISNNVNFVALMPGSVEDSRAYLRQAGIDVKDVVKAEPGAWKMIKGTPTVLLADGQRTVTGVWEGKLGAEEENEILGRISAD